MTQLATVAAYAKLRGCSRQAVEKAAKAGRITLIDSAGGRVIDVDAANLSWAARTDSAQQQRGSKKDFAATQPLARTSAARKAGTPDGAPLPKTSDFGMGLSLLEEKTRSERLRIEKQELDLAERRGELVSAAAMRASWSVKLIAAAEQFQGIPDRLAAVLAAETSAEVVHRKLTEELRNAMAMLSLEPDRLQ